MIIGKKMRTLLGYGVGDFGLNIYWNSLSLVLVFWYAEVVGIDPRTAGFIYFIGLVWDAVSDPVVASIAEHNKSRYGSYRPFVLVGSVFLGLSFCLLFWVPPLDGYLLILVLTIINMLFRTCYTLVAVPYAAMSSRLTYDSRERSELSGVRMGFAFLGMLMITGLWFPLSRYFGGGEENTSHGFLLTAVLGAILATLALILCFFCTQEEPPLGKAKGDKGGLLVRYISALRHNDALLSLLIVVFLNAGAGASLLIPMAFYLEAYSESFAAKEVIMTIFTCATLITIPFWTMLAIRLGKRRVWYIATIWMVISGGALFILGPILYKGVPLQIISFALGGSAFAIIIWSIIPDVVEYGQYTYGERTEAAVFGSSLFAQKASGGLMGLCVGYVLSWVGYDAKRDLQTPEVAEKLGQFFAITSPLMLIAASIVLFFMPLSREEHARIVNELSE